MHKKPEDVDSKGKMREMKGDWGRTATDVSRHRCAVEKLRRDHPTQESKSR